VAELRGDRTTSSVALQFTILTAARTAETIGATWDELDLKKKTWTVPAKRMKAGREHRVRLSDRAVELLTALPRRGVFVFASVSGRPLSDRAMLKNLQERHPGITVHGFRSAFRDWAFERTNYSHKLAELCLAHAIGNETEQAYLRGDGLQKRIRLMQAWADFLSGPRQASATVTSIRKLAGA